MPTVNINVNGQDLSAEVEERQLLVHFLRDDMDLTGTHVGCDTSQCGACVVHVDGNSLKSCTALLMGIIFMLFRMLLETIMVFSVVFVRLE